MKRIPRPLGTTYLSQLYQKEPTKLNKNKLYKHILDAYILNQLFYPTITNTSFVPKSKGLKDLSSWPSKKTKGTQEPTPSKKQENNSKNKTNKGTTIKNVERIPLDVLCIGLGLSEVQVIVRIEKLLAKKSLKVMEEKGYNKVQEINARAHSQGLIFGLLNKGRAHSDWTNELKGVARISNYSPLLIKEANSAIGLDLAITKQLFDMMQKATPKVVVNQQNNFNGLEQEEEAQYQTSSGHYVTTTQVLELMEANGFNTAPLNLEELHAKHLSDPGIPDVKALPSDAQGTIKFDAKDLQYNKHEERRVADFGIVRQEAEPILKKKKKKPERPITIDITPL